MLSIAEFHFIVHSVPSAPNWKKCLEIELALSTVQRHLCVTWGKTAAATQHVILIKTSVA